MLRGDDVQLACYALLEPQARCITYVNDEKEVQIAEEDLNYLTLKCKRMITEFRQDYEKGAALPARGPDKVCRSCNYGGICRKPAWADDPSLRLRPETPGLRLPAPDNA